jgi:hypothetical protein
MSFLRRLFSTGLIGLMCVAAFSTSAVLTAAAQQDDSSQEQQQQQPEQQQERPPVYEMPQSSQDQPDQPAQPQYSEPQPSGSSQPQYSRPQYSHAQQQAEISDPPNPSDQPMEIPNQNAPNGPNGPNQNNEEQNPPGRAARLQYLSGSVSIQPHGIDEWVQGSVNRPLTIADNVWADKESKAELNVGTGLIRIDSETSMTLTDVNDNSVQLSLHQGTMNLHVRHLFDGEVYEVDTPNQAFTILKTGDYRFDVDPNADTTAVTVWRGEGESTGQGPSLRIKSGQTVRFSDGNSMAHYTGKAPRPDAFDDWCQVRSQREDQSVSARYVSPDVVGSEDLDAYGTWRQTPQYGAVWVPTEAPGWAPYAYGHWVFISPWGWTWVDDAPWGYAPFHYGRWVSFGSYWGWAPGPYSGGWARGWYAPALVSWYGGPGWGIGVGFGGIGFGYGGGLGWCALGFGEPFIPWYHTGWGYFRNVNIYNTRITNINSFHNGFRNGFANANGLQHVNMNARGGFTAVNRGTLERGLPVHQNTVRLTSNDVRSAPALGRVSATPTRGAILGPNAGRRAAVAPSSAMSRPVVSHMTPPAASRNTFNSGTRATAPSMGAQANRSTGPASGQSANMARSNGTSSIQGGARPSAYSQRQYVPRPPQTFANNSAAANNSRISNSSMPAARNAPRPAMSNGTANGTRSSQPVQSAMNRAPMTSQQGSVRQSSSSPYFGRSGSTAGPSNVPRPSGPVQPAPRSNYQSSGNSSGYSLRSYGQSSGGYSSRGYSAPQSSQSYGQSQRYSGSPSSSPYSGRSYSGSPYQGGRSYSASPYQGGRSYSAPSYSARSYGGGYSAPSSGGHSYGGGGGYSAPSRGSSSYGGGGSRGGSSSGGSRGSGGSSHSGGHR